jgi:large subunit ribosomal protein L6
MSRVGKAIIEVPSAVKLSINGQTIAVEGPKGKLSHEVHPSIGFQLEEGVLNFTRSDDQKESRSLHGTNRAIVANMIQGVSEGWTKELEIIGVGYRAEAKGKDVNFLLGYSHPILLTPPEGIEVKVEGNNKVVVSGADKEKVGQVAANIRAYRKPEPYKGKGVRYANEYVRRKEVKKS